MVVKINTRCDECYIQYSNLICYMKSGASVQHQETHKRLKGIMLAGLLKLCLPSQTIQRCMSLTGQNPKGQFWDHTSVTHLSSPPIRDFHAICNVDIYHMSHVTYNYHLTS
ncbi:hypothetical protein Lal_00004326 [Lupinus albus]|nr:hypothetical protein Lal_00004326 [Lupinus albus]